MITTPGARLHQHRLRLRLTQEQLADQAGLTQSYIGRIERGERQPTIQVWVRLARLLGVSVTSLIWPTDGTRADEISDSDADGAGETAPRIVEIEDDSWVLTYRGQAFDRNLVLKLIEMLQLLIDGDAISRRGSTTSGTVAWQVHTDRLVDAEESLKDSLRQQAQDHQAGHEREAWAAEAAQLEGPRQTAAQRWVEASDSQAHAWQTQADQIDRLKTIEAHLKRNDDAPDDPADKTRAALPLPPADGQPEPPAN